MAKDVKFFDSLVEYVKLNFKTAKTIDKIDGPNGKWLNIADAKGERVTTMPIGNKSFDGTISEYRVLVTADGVAIATVNAYTTEETFSL